MINDDYDPSTFTFTMPMNAFGGNWNPNETSQGTGISVFIDDISAPVGNIPNTFAGVFWGFYSDTKFTSVILTERNQTADSVETFELDNMVLEVVPIPFAIILGSLGLTFSGCMLKRWRFNEMN